jgi:hypothetical protein
MILVILVLLFVARPRRSGPFLRSPESSFVTERPVARGWSLQTGKEEEQVSAVARWGDGIAGE